MSDTIYAYCDGGYSPAKRRGVWCYQINKPVYEVIEDTKSTLSCNIMEYLAVVNLLKSLQDGARVVVHSDSKLIVNQLTKNWAINWEHLQRLADDVWGIIKSKGLHVAFKWVPRDDNPAGNYIELHKLKIFGGSYRRVKG